MKKILAFLSFLTIILISCSDNENIPVQENDLSDNTTAQSVSTTVSTTTETEPTETESAKTKPAAKNNAMVTETFKGIAFEVSSDWRKESWEYGYHYYLSDGAIQVMSMDIPDNAPISTEDDIKIAFDGIAQGYIDRGTVEEISRTVYKIEGAPALRFNTIEDGMRTDMVIVLFKGEMVAIGTVFPTSEYDSYKETIENILDSVTLC